MKKLCSLMSCGKIAMEGSEFCATCDVEIRLESLEPVSDQERAQAQEALKTIEKPRDKLLRDVLEAITENPAYPRNYVARRVIYMVFEAAAKLVENSARFGSDMSNPDTCTALALMLRNNKHRPR